MKYFFLFAVFIASLFVSDASLAGDVKSTEEICKEQSKNSEYDYVLLRGKVIKASKEFFPLDCFDDCSLRDKLPASFTARLLNPKDVTFFVRTKSETAGELRLKSYYMNENRVYEFCARYIERPEGVVSTEEAFYIDDISTIREIIQ